MGACLPDCREDCYFGVRLCVAVRPARLGGLHSIGSNRWPRRLPFCMGRICIVGSSLSLVDIGGQVCANISKWSVFPRAATPFESFLVAPYQLRPLLLPGSKLVSCGTEGVLLFGVFNFDQPWTSLGNSKTAVVFWLL